MATNPYAGLFGVADTTGVAKSDEMLEQDREAIATKQRRDELMKLAQLDNGQFGRYMALNAGDALGSLGAQLIPNEQRSAEQAAAQAVTKGGSTIDVLKQQADALEAKGYGGSAAKLRERVAALETKEAQQQITRDTLAAKVAEAKVTNRMKARGIDIKAYNELVSKGYIDPASWIAFMNSESPDPTKLKFVEGGIKEYTTKDGKQVVYWASGDGTKVQDLTPGKGSTNVTLHNNPAASTETQADVMGNNSKVMTYKAQVDATNKDIYTRHEIATKAAGLYKLAGTDNAKAAAGLSNMLYRSLATDNNPSKWQLEAVSKAQSALQGVIDWTSGKFTGAPTEATLTKMKEVIDTITGGYAEDAAKALHEGQQVANTPQGSQGLTMSAANQALVFSRLRDIVGIQRDNQPLAPQAVPKVGQANNTGVVAVGGRDGATAGHLRPTIGGTGPAVPTQPINRTPLQGMPTRGGQVFQSDTVDPRTGTKVWGVR